jgi:hypothetical protein
LAPTRASPQRRLSSKTMTNCETTVSTIVRIRKSVAHACEDGTETTKVIDVQFDKDTLMFSAELPEYVAKHNGNMIDPMTVVSDTGNGAISIYEIRCAEYSRWRLGMNAPTQLWIGTFTGASDFVRTAFGFSSVCGIGATPVKVLPDGQMVAVLDDGSIGGPVGSKASATQPVLVDDTPEHRAKVQQLADSIQRAADILTALNLASNPTDYLMAIGDDWRQAPVPKQAELDLKPVVDEDDEL